MFGSAAPAANEVHDFEAIAVRQIGGRPALARNDVVVQLDGHAVCLHAKLLDKRSQRKPLVSKIACFAIDLQTHRPKTEDNKPLG